MLGLIFKGNNFRNLLKYHFEKIEKGSAELIKNNVSTDDNLRDMTECFDQVSENRKSKNTKNEAASIVVSFENGEQPNDEVLNDVAEITLETLGYANHPYAVFRHDDTDNAHIHIAVSRIGYDGVTINSYGDYKLMQQAMRNLEQKHELKVTVKQGLSRQMKYGEYYLRKEERSMKDMLESDIETAINKCTNIDEYTEYLESKGYYVNILSSNKGEKYIKYGVKIDDRQYYFSEQSLHYSSLTKVMAGLQSDRPLKRKSHEEQLTFLRRITKRASLQSKSLEEYKAFLKRYQVDVKLKGDAFYYGSLGVTNTKYFKSTHIGKFSTLAAVEDGFKQTPRVPGYKPNQIDPTPKLTKPKGLGPDGGGDDQDDDDEHKLRKKR